MPVLADIRVALRSLRARPTYALIAIITLSLVVGAGGAVLAVINATFIRPLPFANEDRLLSVYTTPPGSTATGGGAPLQSPAFVRMRERLRTVEIAGTWPRGRALMVNGEAEMVETAGVSPNYFRVLGIPLAAGRMFTEDEDTAAANVVVVSAAFARMSLATESPIGSHVVIDGQAVEVIGVLPSVTERSYLSAAIYFPLAINRSNEPVPASTIVQAVARLTPGVTVDQAASEVAASMREIVSELPAIMTGWSAGVVTLREGLYGDARPALTILFVAVCLLTLIACANLANVTIADMSSRGNELTLRTALGARRSEIVRLVATEHVLVALIGGAAGLFTARVCLPAVLALDANAAASLGDVTIDWRVQAGALALALIVSVVSGILPALAATRGDLARNLAQSSRRTAGSRRQARMRGGLVVVETMIATVLLITSALLFGAFGKVAALTPGFDPSNVLGAQIRLPAERYASHDARAVFVQRMVEEVRSVPGIVSASAAFNAFQPGSGYFTSVIIDGHPTPDGQPRTVQFRRAGPGYFETMKIPEVRGRTFADSDTAASLPVVVISQQMAREFWPGEDALGRRLARGSDATKMFTVIGIVADVRDRGLEQPTAPTIYLPYGQNTNAAAPISLVARTSGDPDEFRRAVTQAVHRVDPSLPLSGFTSLDEYLGASLGPARFRSVLLLAFAGLGLLLAAVGIYGVTARGVGERTREMGIRLALGSGRGALWRLVLWQSLGAVGGGIALGIPAAVLSGVFVSRSVNGIALGDLWTALPSVLVLVAAGGLAAAVPTLRATRVNPVVALRGE
jgi:putative ABC transport system permease protein